MAMAIAPLCIVGCGSSGTDSGASTTGTGVVYGRIDGFGSIHIANRRLVTDANTQVVIGDDDPKIWDDSMMTDGTLKEGQIAMVREDSGHADRVTVDETVKGPVDSTNPLVVMGQTVVQSAGTVIDDCPADLVNADVIEAYGLVNASGAIEANIIECKTSAEVKRYSVIGAVSNLNGNTFTINALTVDFSNADIGDLPGGLPQAGQLVQVKDDNKAYNGGSGDTLFATKVEPQLSPGALGSTDDDMEIESYVTDASGLPGSFKMGDLTINISASTAILFGDVSLIQNGVKLEAEGHINSLGELDADKIKFEDNDSRIDALVSSVDLNNNSINLLNENVSVVVDGNTKLEDNITLQNISVGDSLEVSGFLGSNGKFVASEIKRGSQQADLAELRSSASSLDATAGSMVILGVTINTSDSTKFKDDNDAQVTKAAFFAALVANVTTVQAKWDPYNGDVSAPVKELELEDD